ncbi:MAG: hypothetical protein HY721_23015 [Planctomycetes bacterium]|nr:hypothetical protein [Planctomycetota bacterium]
MSEWFVVENASSRMGRSAGRRARAAAARRGLGGSPSLRWLDLKDLGEAQGRPERVIVVGGDGSINAAATWLLERGLDCPIAVVPAGTGNNLARGLGLPLDAADALELAFAGGRTRPLDAIAYQARGEGRRRIAIQTAALGFPAEIAGRYDALRRHRLFRFLCVPAGPYIYRILAFLGLAAQKRRERRGDGLLGVRCSLPGEVLEESVFAIFIGNERSLGGNFHPCPRAEVDDGALDLCLIRAGTGARYLELFRSIIRGEHLSLERTVVYRQTRGPVEIELSQPCRFLADGDLWVQDQGFRLEVLPRRFRVIAGSDTMGA